MIRLESFMFRKTPGFKRCWWRTEVGQTNSNKLVKPWCTTSPWPSCQQWKAPFSSQIFNRSLSLEGEKQLLWSSFTKKKVWGCAALMAAKQKALFLLFISALAFVQTPGQPWLKGLSWKQAQLHARLTFSCCPTEETQGQELKLQEWIN